MSGPNKSLLNTNSVAVVTGAASGIGAALVRSFAELGMQVVAADIEAAPLQALVSELNQQSYKVIAQPTDVTQADAVENLAKVSFERFGSVQVLCNNAGVMPRLAPLWEQSPQEWRWVFDVNLMGMANGIRAFVPRLLAQGSPAHVVNTASEASFSSRPYVGIYHASKHAVFALTETLALELALANAQIQVSALCPGGVNTRIMEAARNRPLANSPTASTGGGATLEAIYKYSLAKASSPTDVAQTVIRAIREQKFFAFSHPEVADLPQQRADAARQNRYPTVDPALANRLRNS